jgi:hypothetical protein
LRGLQTVVDAAGNLIVRKPATPGHGRPRGRGVAGPSGHGMPGQCRYRA